jgi:hypothetical protein
MFWFKSKPKGDARAIFSQALSHAIDVAYKSGMSGNEIAGDLTAHAAPFRAADERASEYRKYGPSRFISANLPE